MASTDTSRANEVDPPIDSTPDATGTSERRSGGSLGRIAGYLRRGRLRQIDFVALEQFVANVRSEIDLLPPCAAREAARRRPIVRKITDELELIRRSESLEKNWGRAHHAEKLMLTLLPEGRARAELARRTERVRRAGMPFASYYRDALVKLDADEAGWAVRGRDLLLSMADDVQSHNGRRFIRMRYARLAIYKAGLAFVFAFVVFIGVLTYGHWLPPDGLVDEARDVADVTGSGE